MRRPRTWLALGGAMLGTFLASLDGRTAWTVVVGAVLLVLAFWTVATTPEDPEAEAREAAKHQARVDKILERYERERASRTNGDAERDT